MSTDLTLRSVFDRLSQGREYITQDDLRRVAEEADAKTSVMGFDVIGKMWERLDPQGKTKLAWEDFTANGSALIPGEVTSDPDAAAAKIRELFDQADVEPRNGALSHGELRAAVAKQLPFLVRKAASQAAADVAFAILGVDRKGEELPKDGLESLLDDIRRHVVLVNA